MATKLQIVVGHELFRFKSFRQWIDEGHVMFEASGYEVDDTIRVDAQGHICVEGIDYKQAAYPVIVYALHEG